MDDMDKWWNEMVDQVKSTPPACLAGFRPKLEEAEEVHGGARVGWSLVCSCGGATGKVLGYPLKDFVPDHDGDQDFVSPLAFECAACGKQTEIIDTGVHGYDGELDKRQGRINTITYRGSGERTAAVCPRCKAAAYMVTTRFSHPHFDLFEDEPELGPVAQDFFDVFDCACKCPNCGEEWSVANFELA